jgi:hypothetical protein
MTDITIPDEALEAGARSACHEAYKHLPEMREQDTYTPDADYWLNQARAAFLAMIEAWPGMTLHQQDINAEYSYFVLPLPQEASDDK